MSVRPALLQKLGEENKGLQKMHQTQHILEVAQCKHLLRGKLAEACCVNMITMSTALVMTIIFPVLSILDSVGDCCQQGDHKLNNSNKHHGPSQGNAED